MAHNQPRADRPDVDRTVDSFADYAYRTVADYPDNHPGWKRFDDDIRAVPVDDFDADALLDSLDRRAIARGHHHPADTD